MVVDRWHGDATEAETPFRCGAAVGGAGDRDDALRISANFERGQFGTETMWPPFHQLIHHSVSDGVDGASFVPPQGSSHVVDFFLRLLTAISGVVVLFLVGPFSVADVVVHAGVAVARGSYQGRRRSPGFRDRVVLNIGRVMGNLVYIGQ